MYEHCLLLSRGHAAEACIDILIMSLEPVAERRTQHACSRARRSAFHDEVLAIEEICGVSRIERKRFKTGEGREGGGGPLPTVAQKSFHAERAAALGIGVHRGRIPRPEIEVSKSCCRRVVAPWVIALTGARRSVRCAMPL